MVLFQGCSLEGFEVWVLVLLRVWGVGCSMSKGRISGLRCSHLSVHIDSEDLWFGISGSTA